MTPLIVGIAGGSGSGKTYLAKQLVAEFGVHRASLLSMDQYFKSEVTDPHEAGAVNFDHPSHLDFHLLISHVKKLASGKSVWAPSYDFQMMRQTPRSILVEPRPVIVVEGLFVLADPMVSLCDLTCFLDVETDERLLGRILRDVKERGAAIEQVIDRYQRFVRPSYQIFVAPTKQNADVVVDFTFRRALFSRQLIGLLKGYLEGSQTRDEFVHQIRTETYHAELDPKEGFMSLTTDIFKLAKAYPEKAELRHVEQPLASPAAVCLGRRSN